MSMAESDSREEVSMNSGVKSAWKRPIHSGEGFSVMGTETWPALSDLQTKLSKTEERNLNISPLVLKGSGGQNKSQVDENNNPPQARHKKSGFKQNLATTSHLHDPLTNTPSIPPVLHTRIPGPHTPVSSYSCQPLPARLPRVESPIPNAAPPIRGNIQSQLRGDLIFFNTRLDVHEKPPHFNHPWYPPIPFIPPNNIHMQQHIGLVPFPRPQFLGQSPGFMVGPRFPGPGTLFYYPITLPGSLREPHHQPHFIPYPTSQGPPMVSLETMALKDKIINQIEYYFSDINLQNDHYLISMMDAHGWVPISIIADFRRVKQISKDKSLILVALTTSDTVEVQGQKIRRRNEWAKWIQTSESTKSEDNAEISRDKGSCSEHLPSDKSTAKVFHSGGTVLYKCEAQNSCGENVVSSDILISEPNICNGDPLQNCSEGAESTRENDLDIKSMKMPCDKHKWNIDDVSADFACSFRLDEELELGQKSITKDHSLIRRMKV